MSKRAEEAQASAILPESIISYAKEHAVLSGLVYREGVKFGYERAEKDLALTWEDVKKIEDLCMEVTTLFASVGRNKVILEPPFYEEVLRRFNSQREKK